MRRQAFENLGDIDPIQLSWIHEVQLARSELYKLAKYANQVTQYDERC